VCQLYADARDLQGSGGCSAAAAGVQQPQL
jgi:hypothetical protein